MDQPLLKELGLILEKTCFHHRSTLCDGGCTGKRLSKQFVRIGVGPGKNTPRRRLFGVDPLSRETQVARGRIVRCASKQVVGGRYTHSKRVG